jgi:ATP/maltotriose-dependent transcriptional regulator MalT
VLPSSGYIESLLDALQPNQEEDQIYSRKAELPAIAQTDFPIGLSPREMDVLSLIAEGKSNQEISAQLYLALNTVKRHASNIYAKLDVKKRTHAVSKARELGLIL